MEAVQKGALRYCQGLSGHSYEEKFKKVGLTTLVDHRHQIFKILKCLNDVDYHTWFSTVHELHQKTRQAVTVAADSTCSYADNIALPKAKLDIRKNFFNVRVVNFPIWS